MPMGPDLMHPSPDARDRVAKLNWLIEMYRAEIEGPQPDPFHEDGGYLTARLVAILRSLIDERDSLRKELGESSGPE
jgi:hypothetical protein